jgi:uncharacterized repeat protein (TIGR03899 family)
MAEINIIKIDGKPLEKLIDVISQGIGTLYRPRGIKKDADAKAYEIEIIERAKSKALAEGKEIEAETYDRIQDRLLNKEIRRQNNIDNVSQIAMEQLSQEKVVSEDPVDEDWTTRFFNIIEDVSDSEMQNLWGRILAGEVKQPNSYSLRTLEILKNLSQKEAEIFTKFARLALVSNNTSFILNPESNEFLMKEYQITFNDRLLLEEAGLITANDLTFQLKGQKMRTPFLFGKIVLLAERLEGCPEQHLPILVFTKTGSDLLKLIEQPMDQKYFTKFAELLKNEKNIVSYAYVLEKTETNIRHTNPPIRLTV